ncbi:MAG: tetratricopeptide repeat protein [Actinomycetes bacterium]
MSQEDASRHEPGDDDGREPMAGGAPGGEVYDWYVRAIDLLEAGSPEAAAALLTHAHAREPASASVLEALARASFDAGRYDVAADHFSSLAQVSPDNDYAYFGLGLARMRLGDHVGAIEHLAMAAAMRPQRKEYDQALREARATIRFREQGP